MISSGRRPAAWMGLAAGGLGVLLVGLGVLQYRWLGEVSSAERERMRANLETRATDFAEAFDRELTRLFVAFHVDPAQFDTDPAGAISKAYSQMPGAATAPSLVRGIYVVDPRDREPDLKRFDPAGVRLQRVPWPVELREWRRQLNKMATPSAPSAILYAGAVDASIPAVIVAVPRVEQSIINDRRRTVIADPSSPARMIVVVLDESQLRHQLLEPLVATYFRAAGPSDYVLTIVSREDPSRMVFSSEGGASVDPRSADVMVGLFRLRTDELDGGAGPSKKTVAVTILRRLNRPDSPGVFTAGAASQGAWQMFARHRSDSLDAIVTRARRRNFAIVMAILTVLAGSVTMILASTDRQRRLARQHMEFVAAVSHELRTPLAVICSAGENLSDGLVTDPDQIKHYGAAVEAEGRRLTDMVERVMRFAGFASGMRTRSNTPVDVEAIIGHAIGATSADARDRRVIVSVHLQGHLPRILGDAEALRSAIQNVVDNAVKYSPVGGSVDVTVGVRVRRVHVRVVDHGLGIDGRDLPHLFQPFYRGRRAIDAQIRGSRIGLSVVRSIVDEHGGKIRIESRPDVGTTVTIELPVGESTPSTHGGEQI